MIRPIGFLILLSFAPIAHADEKDDEIAKQKAAALALLKQCDVMNGALLETPDLFVAGGFPEAKLKTMGDLVQKSYASAIKALKFEADQNPFKAKLTVYFLPDRKQLSAFVGAVLNDRLDKGDRSQVDAVYKYPYAAISVYPGEKPIDLEAEAANQIAVALLRGKAGSNSLPQWMEDGFVKALKMRAAPLSPDRTAIRKMLAETKTVPAKYKVADVWGPNYDKEKQLLAGSLMEFFVFGPESAKLGKILAGMRPMDGAPAPKMDAVLMSLEMPLDKLDIAWKKYAMTGK